MSTADETTPEPGLGTLLASSFDAFSRPDTALDPYLDAFAAAVQRFGVGRTRMHDVAAEMGVDRTTVFRNAGSLDQIAAQYLAREVHRFFDAILDDVDTELSGPDLVVEAVASAIDRARAHPVLAKALADEPDLVARLAYNQLGTLISHTCEVVSNGLTLLAGLGLVDPVDGDAVGECIARIGLTAVIEPPDDLRSLLRSMLGPMLAG